MAWSGVPEGTAGFAIIVDDPDAPGGTHRYFFNLYALDTTLGLEPGVRKSELVSQMEGHVLAQAQVMGTYTR